MSHHRIQYGTWWLKPKSMKVAAESGHVPHVGICKFACQRARIYSLLLIKKTQTFADVGVPSQCWYSRGSLTYLCAFSSTVEDWVMEMSVRVIKRTPWTRMLIVRWSQPGQQHHLRNNQSAHNRRHIIKLVCVFVCKPWFEGHMFNYMGNKLEATTQIEQIESKWWTTQAS